MGSKKPNPIANNDLSIKNVLQTDEFIDRGVAKIYLKVFAIICLNGLLVEVCKALETFGRNVQIS